MESQGIESGVQFLQEATLGEAKLEGLWVVVGAAVGAIGSFAATFIGQRYEARRARERRADEERVWRREAMRSSFSAWLQAVDFFVLFIESKYEEFERYWSVAQSEASPVQRVQMQLSLEAEVNSLERTTWQTGAPAKLWANKALREEMEALSELVSRELTPTLGKGRQCRDTVKARLNDIHDRVLAMMQEHLGLVPDENRI